jgi:hypothetical protein
VLIPTALLLAPWFTLPLTLTSSLPLTLTPSLDDRLPDPQRPPP